MGKIVQFSPRLAGPDIRPEQVITIRDLQVSLAQSARTLSSSLASLGESLQKADALICYIDDAVVRETLRLTLASSYREFLKAATKTLNAVAVCEKEHA